MKPDSKKNQQLIKQYPFLEEVLSEPMAPYGVTPSDHFPEVSKIDNLTIRVEKADGDLMYRRGHNVGLGDYSCIFQMGDKRKDQVMRQGEYAFAIGKNGKIINRLDFPRNEEEQRQNLSETYAWTVLWRSKMLNASGTGYLYGDPVTEKTKYIVWVTVEAWHTNTKNNNAPESRFGDLRDRSIKLTVYGEPEQGFGKLQEEANVYENLFLDSHVMIRGAVDKNHDILAIGGMLYEMCITFQDEVYFNGMKEILDNSEYRGASGEFGPVKVMCAEMCGYDRVMLEDSLSYITFQLRPDSKHMYVLGQQGTLPHIRNLVKTVVKMWHNPKVRAAFQPDKNVSVM